MKYLYIAESKKYNVKARSKESQESAIKFLHILLESFRPNADIELILNRITLKQTKKK